MLNPLTLLAIALSTKANTRNQQDRRFKGTIGLPSLQRQGSFPSKISWFPIWQLTVPLSVLFITTVGPLTAYFVSEGIYAFDFSLSQEQIRIRTYVDKRSVEPTEK